MKVLISDSLSEKAVEILEKAEGIECVFDPKITPEDLLKTIGEYDGLAVRSRTKVTKEVLEAGTKLKVVGRAGIGVDNIDIAEATKNGVIVMNTPGGNTTTTAEHAISMMMALARKIPQATSSMKAGKWEKKLFEGVEMTGKTLGIVGIGNIGSIVANRAQGLHMDVIAYDPFISEEAADKLGIGLVELDELYKRSDFISIHVPATKETLNMINKTAFGKMKDSVRIVNCARGGIINEADLAEAITSGKVAGAALDVLVNEPPEEGNPVIGLDNVILTPHLGASTGEAQENVAVAVSDQIADYLINGTIRNAINVPSVAGESLAQLSPYITLAEKLGSFQGQLIKGAVEEVTIEYSGDVTDLDVAPVTIAALKGLLENVVGDNVNFVNAPVVAEERGIKVVEVKSSRNIDFASSVTVKVKTKDEESLAEGAIFGKTEPRIVRYNKFLLDAVTEGTLLVLHNDDKPGVIGEVGTVLGEGGVNIAGLHLSREVVGGESVSIWSIDSAPKDEILDKLKKVSNVISAEVVEL